MPKSPKIGLEVRLRLSDSLEMNPLATNLVKAANRLASGEGITPLPTPGVVFFKYSHPAPQTKRRWRACFGIIFQGAKEITLGANVYPLKAFDYTVAPLELPVLTRISGASVDKPMIGILIDLNPAVLSEIASQIPTVQTKEKSPIHALFRGKADEKMLKALLRLLKLSKSSEEARVLGPLVVKEILYYVLVGSQGAAIRQFVRSGSKMHQISQAVHRLKSDLGEEVDVGALAKVANMSRAAFFVHFKEAMSMSPIQYQKRLRLLEAKRLMIEEGESAEGSAYKVGYKSASQFSREYSRMFGNSPLRDVALA